MSFSNPMLQPAVFVDQALDNEAGQHMNGKLTLLAIFTASTTILAIGFYFKNNQLNNELQLTQDLQAQLLEQAQLNSQLRLDFENQFTQLEQNLRAMQNRLSSQSVALQEAREDANPDIEMIREQARLEAERSVQNGDSGISVVESRMLDPLEASRLTAQTQVDRQYAEFLQTLQVDANRKDLIRQAIIEFTVAQSRSGLNVLAVNIGAEEFPPSSNAKALANHLAKYLTTAQQTQFDHYQNELAQRQSRRLYQSQIATMAPDLTATNGNLLIDSLYQEMVAVRISTSLVNDVVASNASHDNAVTAIDRQLNALIRVREHMSTTLDASQMREAENLLTNMEARLQLSRAIAAQAQSN